MVACSRAAVLLMALALAACAPVSDLRYEDILRRSDPVPADRTRLVFLRPGNRYDDYIGWRPEIAVNGEPVGEIAYGAFFIVDVPAGEMLAKVPADSPDEFACELRGVAEPAHTVFIDVAPRGSYIAAGVVGSVAGLTLVGESLARAVVGMTVGGAVGYAAESAGQDCGGPFRFVPMEEEPALAALEGLGWSR